MGKSKKKKVEVEEPKDDKIIEKTLKIIAISILTTVMLGTVGFVGSSIFEIQKVKAEVIAQKGDIKSIKIDVRWIKNFLIKKK